MPNPSPTTDACNRYFVSTRVWLRNGVVKARPMMRPAASATGGDAQGLSAKSNPRMKMNFRVPGFMERLAWSPYQKNRTLICAARPNDLFRCGPVRAGFDAPTLYFWFSVTLPAHGRAIPDAKHGCDLVAGQPGGRADPRAGRETVRQC